MLGWIIIGGLSALIIAMSIYLLTGRGGFLIAGYNTAPKSEKDKLDEKRLCKFMGKILLPIGVLTLLLGIESIASWFFWVYMAAIFGLVIFAAVYANTGNRFRK